MGFRYQDYFDIQIKSPQKRKEVIEALQAIASTPEGLQKIQEAKELHGWQMPIVESAHGSHVDGNVLRLSFYQIENAYYIDVHGDRQPASTTRILAHEIFHLADPSIAPYLEQNIERIAQIRQEGMKKAEETYHATKASRMDTVTQMVENPLAFSRAEAMEQFRLLQGMADGVYIQRQGEDYYLASPEFSERMKLLEEPAVAFENLVMEKLGETPRAGYEAAYAGHNYRKSLLAIAYKAVDEAGFPVNPEPAMDATCSIPPGILEKINRGEITLAQAGITLDPDETLPDAQEGCLVVTPATPSAEAGKDSKQR